MIESIWNQYYQFILAGALMCLLLLILYIKHLDKKKKKKTVNWEELRDLVEQDKKPKKPKAEKPKVIEQKLEAKKEFNPIEERKFSIANLRKWLKERRHKDKLVLINMELSNGYHKTWLEKLSSDGNFEYNKKTYIIDNSLMYYHISTGYFALDYHEQISLPIRRKIPVSNIKETLESIDHENRTAINPAILTQFLDSNVVEGVMKSGEISEWLKQMRLILIVVLIASLIHLIIYIQQSGILAQLNIG